MHLEILIAKNGLPELDLEALLAELTNSEFLIFIIILFYLFLFL